MSVCYIEVSYTNIQTLFLFKKPRILHQIHLHPIAILILPWALAQRDEARLYLPWQLYKWTSIGYAFLAAFVVGVVARLDLTFSNFVVAAVALAVLYARQEGLTLVQSSSNKRPTSNTTLD